jgi:Baseplate J-like protein
MQFPSRNELYQRAVRQLTAAGMTDAATPGSATNLMLVSIMDRLGENSADNLSSYNNSFRQNASGFYLDFFGEADGLRRGSSAAAVVLAQDKNLKFYTNRGTIKSRLGGVIPQDTKVTDAGGTVVFLVNETLVPDGVDAVYVTAVSRNIAEGGNVGSGVLSAHGLLADDVLVTNEKPIFSGRSTEPDGLYRERLLRHTRGAIAVTADEVIASVLAIPGITRAQYVPAAFGVNHPAILLSGADRLQASARALAEAVTASILPLGVRVLFLLPTYLELDLSLVVTVSASANKAVLRGTIESAVRDILSNTAPGTRLDLTALDAELTRRYPDIQDVEIGDARLAGSKVSGRFVELREFQQMVLTELTVDII